MKQHPLIYHRDCSHCLKYLYNEETGKVELDRDKQPLERPIGAPSPCRRRGHECPKGTPEKPKTLNFRNELAYAQFRRCKVTGRWPDDELVIDRAVLIDELEEVCKADQSLSQLQLLVGMQVARNYRAQR